VQSVVPLINNQSTTTIPVPIILILAASPAGKASKPKSAQLALSKKLSEHNSKHQYFQDTRTPGSTNQKHYYQTQENTISPSLKLKPNQP
jgi:hypothetical protein